MQVAVVGPREASAAELEAAHAVGAGIAAAGHVVVTGGRGGVMAAATAGAASVGGTTVALLPGDDAADAAPGATVIVPTGMGEARNVLVVRAADVVVAIGGSWGTLSELALACRHGTPVVALDTWALADAGTRTGSDPIVRVPSAEVAIRAALGILGHTA